MPKMTVEQLQEGLIKHDKGVLKYGSHKAGDREFCALEFRSVMQGIHFTDAPNKVGMPDLRRLNDAFGNGHEADQVRTKAMLPVLAALWDWQDWSKPRRTRFAQLLAVMIVNQITADLPKLPKAIKRKCQEAKNCEEACNAAAAAAAAAAADAAYAARFKVLNLACQLFVDAAEQSA